MHFFSKTNRAEPTMQSTTYDAIVVGSGISGGWAAKELTEKGLRVLLLERGKNIEHIKDYVNASAAMGIVPRRFGRIHVILDVLDVLATLEQQDPESFLRELFRGPTAGDAGADHDGVVILRLHDSSFIVRLMQ